MLRVLRGGFNVWLTDVDAVFNSDPFLHVDDAHGAMFAYDTPFLPKGKNSPLMVMAGFWFMRQCALHPHNCELLEATLAHQAAHKDKHDQARPCYRTTARNAYARLAFHKLLYI